jgi:hypothetical protein
MPTTDQARRDELARARGHLTFGTADSAYAWSQRAARDRAAKESTEREFDVLRQINRANKERWADQTAQNTPAHKGKRI